MTQPDESAPAGVRRRILDAAVALFAEQGYDATSVQQVVVRAGVTKGALYHYFAAKEDLLFEIYSDLLVSQLAGLDRILALGLPPEAALRAIIDDLVATTAEHATAAAVFKREESRLGQQRWQQLQTDWRRYQDAVRGLLRQAQSDGVFSTAASPEVVSWAIFGLTTTLPTWYRPDGPKKPADISRELADFVLAGLRP
jgi:AcrR family transcriptional regulator